VREKKEAKAEAETEGEESNAHQKKTWLQKSNAVKTEGQSQTEKGGSLSEAELTPRLTSPRFGIQGPEICGHCPDFWKRPGGTPPAGAATPAGTGEKADANQKTAKQNNRKGEEANARWP